MTPEVHGTSRSGACFSWIAGLLLFSTAAGVAGSSADSAGKPCVAVLEAEVVGKMPGDERKALAGWLDTLLTESLAKRKDFVTVDRQALDKVLAEKTAKAGGLTKIDPKDVAASLRPFWAAGILICPVIRQASPKEAAPGKMIVSVEAVLAQTGQLLASLYVQADGKNEQGFRKPLAGKLGAFWQDAGTHLRQRSGKPLVDISGKLTSKITRLQWMVDDLRDAAEARMALAQNVVPLVPRQPLNTKEERLLRVMGLSAAKPGDKAAGLGPAPDIRLLMELTETVKTGLSFTKTPISLKLSLQRAKSPAVTTAIKSEVGQWEACRKKALAWIDTQVRALSKGSPTAKADDEARARKLAREELATVAQWAKLSQSNQKYLDIPIRLLIAKRALRAAHLDPTNEEAAYLVAINVDALYAARGQAKTLACYDRTIAECTRYLDRFGRKVVPHHHDVLRLLGNANCGAAFSFPDSGITKNAILREPDVRVYPYVRGYVRVWAERGYLAETDKRYAGTNAFVAFGYALVKYLIPNCPREQLDEEHAYWRNWWKTKVQKVVRDKGNTNFTHGPPVPWYLVEAVFQARKKNPKAVRAALQQMADKYPKSNTTLWGGDRHKTYRVPVYLRAAGDPQWNTWQPTFERGDSIRISPAEMTRFMSQFKPRTPDAWPLSNVPVIATTEFVVPQRVQKTAGVKSRWRGAVDGLLLAGKDIWLVTPATWIGNPRDRNNLFVAPVGPARNRKVLLDPVAISWPKQTADQKQRPPGKPLLTYGYAASIGNNPTVWLGTKAHGLARFDKTGGKWTGRWYTTRNGMPTNGITRISTCRADGKQVMLLVDQNTRRMFKKISPRYTGPQTMVWTLDPGTGDVKLLFDGSKSNTCINWLSAGTLTDGRKVLLDLLGEGVYGNVDIKDVTEINEIDSDFYFPVRGAAIPVTRESGKSATARIWSPFGGASLNELSLDTLKPMRGSSLGKGDRQLSVFPVRMSVGGLLGVRHWGLGNYATVADRWPAGRIEQAAGRKEVLWLAVRWRTILSSVARYIVGYRPAPKGSKDWAQKDRWFGPFHLPGHSVVNRMVSYGENGLLLSTGTGVYRMDCAEAIAQAERGGRARSTAEWRKQYEKRLAEAGWQSVVVKVILDKRWDDALKLLDGRQKQLGAITKTSPRKNRDEWIRLQLWRAHVYAKKPGGLPMAIEAYAQVAGAPFVEHSAEVLARMIQILMLHKAKRWQEMLDLCEKVTSRFPQTKPIKRPGGLMTYINDAKQNLKKASDSKDSKVGP